MEWSGYPTLRFKGRRAPATKKEVALVLCGFYFTIKACKSLVLGSDTVWKNFLTHCEAHDSCCSLSLESPFVAKFWKVLSSELDLRVFEDIPGTCVHETSINNSYWQRNLYIQWVGGTLLLPYSTERTVTGLYDCLITKFFLFTFFCQCKQLRTKGFGSRRYMLKIGK